MHVHIYIYMYIYIYHIYYIYYYICANIYFLEIWIYIYIYIISLIYHSEFHAYLQSLGIQFYFYLPKNKQIQICKYKNICHIKMQNIFFQILIHTSF